MLQSLPPLLPSHGALSISIYLNTFSLYTNKCWSNASDVFNVKFADDAVIVGLITVSWMCFLSLLIGLSWPVFFSAKYQAIKVDCIEVVNE